MTMYEQIASKRGGASRLAAARLRYKVLTLLHSAAQASPLNQSELAAALGVRKSAVSQVLRGDGNVRVNTLAEYAFELGFEIEIELVPAGTARVAATEFAPQFDAEWTLASSRSVEKMPAPQLVVSTRGDFEWAA